MHEKRYVIVKSEREKEMMESQTKLEVLILDNNLANEITGKVLKRSVEISGIIEIHYKSNTLMRQTKFKYLHTSCIPKKKNLCFQGK